MSSHEKRVMQRRRFLTAVGTTAALGTAGCLGSGDDTQDDTPASDGSTCVPDEGLQSAGDTPQASFRDWLVVPENTEIGVSRFSYTESDQLIAQNLQGRASVLDIEPSAVDATLIQSLTLLLFGEFDRPAIESTIGDTDGYTLTGSYRSYRTARNTETDTQFAFDEEVVVVGNDLELWIDTHAGDRERLETSTPVFTELFDRAPTPNVEGQPGPPPEEGFPDDIDAWLVSLPGIGEDAEEIGQTWIYAFDDPPSDNDTQAVRQTLSSLPLVKCIDETATDGRFLRVTGAVTLDFEVPLQTKSGRYRREPDRTSLSLSDDLPR